MLIPHFAAATRVCIASCLLLLAGCAGLVPEVPTPAADPSASVATAPPRSVLETDDVTRKTQRLLAASGATRLEGLKPMKHDMSMDGMDHGGMKEMTSLPGADHSKMPSIQRQPRTGAPAGEQHHKGMEGMDHSGMHGTERSGEAPGQAPPKQRTGTSVDHGAHSHHGGKPSSPMDEP